MEEDETAAHELLHCPEVATYRAKYFGNPGTLREIVSNIKALLAFLGELGWSNKFPTRTQNTRLDVELRTSPLYNTNVKASKQNTSIDRVIFLEVFAYFCNTSCRL